ncbi:hypothetical protein, partial [Escherichia coli]|uniref:hypothetical protein n=1 Tax=Escherichia coli TaxID=562 RepID=UPI00208DA4FD
SSARAWAENIPAIASAETAITFFISIISVGSYPTRQRRLLILKPCKRQGKKRKFDRIDRQNRSCMMKISYRRHENGKEWFKR